MNPEQLKAFFAKNKTTMLAAGGAGVVGLALLQRKKAAAGGSSPAGTIPAAGVVPSSGVQGVYPDTSAVDVYNSLQPTLEKILRQNEAATSAGGSGLGAPAPIASTLFAPTGSGNYVRYGSSIAEVQSDGSLFAPTFEQWAALAAQGAKSVQVSGSDAALPKYYTTAGNLATKNPKT